MNSSSVSRAILLSKQEFFIGNVVNEPQILLLISSQQRRVLRPKQRQTEKIIYHTKQILRSNLKISTLEMQRHARIVPKSELQTVAQNAA